MTRRCLLGASLLGLAMAACGAPDTGSTRLGCEDDTCKSRARGDESTSAPGGEAAAQGDPYSNVARPVTPATPPSTTTTTPTGTTPGTTPGTPVAAPPPPAAAPPPPVFATAPITRRYFNGDHLYTRDANEAPEWTYEGVPFLVFEAPHENTQPIFRCLAGTQHFVSNDTNCEGFISEGALGWLSTTPGADRFELVRCRNATGSDHLASTAEECNAAGYVIEGTLGFALRP